MTNRISDEGDPRKYYSTIPHVVDDAKLSVYAYRLYGHIKRVAGDEGNCYQGTRTLALSCGMSTGSVSSAKKELVKEGLIKITKKQGNGGVYDSIIIQDIWSKNMNQYQAKRCSPGETEEEGVHLVAKRCSPGETKNNTIKNNTLKRYSSEYPEFLFEWEKNFPNKPQPRKGNGTLKQKLNTRLKNKFFKENYKAALTRASRSKFLNGAGFFQADWFLRNEENWEKCFNGNYDNSGASFGKSLDSTQPIVPPPVTAAELEEAGYISIEEEV